MANVISTLQELFDDFGDTLAPPHANRDTAVDIVDFPTVHKEDSEPFTIIWPDLERGPWIAGGAALRWWQGQPVGESDIDVFCANAKQAEEIIANIKSYGRWQRKFESDNATTLSYWSKENTSKQWTIQIIKRRYFDSLQEVINSFDMTVCEIGTSGNDWVLGKETAKDIRERNLRLKYPLQSDALKRVVKYWTYGYRPVEGVLDAVQNNPVGKWEFSIEGDYENAF
jgi:hypothetical protein